MSEYSEMKKLEEENEIRFHRGDYPVGYRGCEEEPEHPCITCIECYAEREKEPCIRCKVLHPRAVLSYYKHYKGREMNEVIK